MHFMCSYVWVYVWNAWKKRDVMSQLSLYMTISLRLFLYLFIILLHLRGKNRDVEWKRQTNQILKWWWSCVSFYLFMNKKWFNIKVSQETSTFDERTCCLLLQFVWCDIEDRLLWMMTINFWNKTHNFVIFSRKMSFKTRV